MDEVVRYSFRLRPGRTAESALLAEWHRCRFLWNEAVHQQKTGNKPTFSTLSKLLTAARSRSVWLRAGSQVVQQQTLRTYAQTLTQSFTVKGRGRPVFKARKRTRVSLEYTRNGDSPSSRVVWCWPRVSVFRWCGRGSCPPTRPKFLAKSSTARKAADAAIGATKRELIERGVRAGRRVVLVQPAFTTMTCSGCFARAKQRLELAERTFRCQDCGFTEDRDRNAARVILAVAERGCTRVEDVRRSDHLPRVFGSGAV